jgi:hypothetical protein
MADELEENSRVTEISYCPDLGLYHHWTCEGEEAFFTTDMLEKSIDSLIKAGKSAEAEFMVWLTAAARLHPHQIASFNAEGECTLRNPFLNSEDLEGEEEGDDDHGL